MQLLRLHLVDHIQHILLKASHVELQPEPRQGAADVARAQTEHCGCLRRKPANAQVGSHHHDRQTDAVKQVGEVVIQLGEELIAMLHLLVDRMQFLVGRFQFFFRGLQLFIRTLQLFVTRLDLFIGGLQLLVRALL